MSKSKINELFFEAIKDENIEATKFLFEKGADIDAKNEDEYTPFYCACSNNNIEVVKFLFEKGADIEIECSCGWLSIHRVCYFGYQDILKFLLKINVNLKSKTTIGQTPLDLAKENNQTEVVKLLEDEIKRRTSEKEEEACGTATIIFPKRPETTQVSFDNFSQTEKETLNIHKQLAEIKEMLKMINNKLNEND